MTAGFRGWLYRFVSALFGLIGITTFITGAELSRFYGLRSIATGSWVGLGLSFLLLMTAFFTEWRWKRYFIVSLSAGVTLSLVYLALRPEMIRDDVLKQVRTPPLSADLVIYRAMVLGNDPGRDAKIERLSFLYGFLRSFGENSDSEKTDRNHAPIPEAH